MRNKKITLMLTESAILIGMGIALSMIKLFQMPLGGSVTPASMLPICIISLRYGVKWGLVCSFIYSITQLVLGILLDGLLAWGLSPLQLVECIFLDYIIAYSFLGLTGLFKKKGKPGIYLGFILSFSLRLLSHVLSGYIIFKNLDQWSLFGSTFINMPILYSLSYNALYILPELVITFIILTIILNVDVMKKYILDNN